MTVSSEAIAYLQQQAPVIFLVLEENGVVVAANEHTKEVFGGSPVGKHFKDLIIDFRHNFSIDKINEDPSRETLINITTGSGLPRSYYFTFKKLSGHFIVFGRIDVEEFEKMQKEVISLNKDLNNLTRELYKKNALLKKTNDDLKIANDKIVEISRRDPLTQLYNRRYFEEKIKEMISLARRHSQPLSIIMTDIDKFKVVNDSFGHDAGDRVLVDYALLMRENTREEDLVARFGGEEFVIALPYTDGNQASLLAERLRKRLSQLDLLGNGHLVTASYGVSQWKQNEDITDLLKRADKALYQAKGTGRNRTIFIG
mgnify:CR=1 FL=1